MHALREVPDPEMPISIVDLGLVKQIAITADSEDRVHVAVELLPTFTGCPALDMIRDLVTKRLCAMPGVAGASVTFTFDPPWSVDRITDEGRASLRAHGVTVPPRGSGERLSREARPGTTMLSTSAVPCPFCRSTRTRLDSPFGPTRCRMIFYCDACRNSFEHMKAV